MLVDRDQHYKINVIGFHGYIWVTRTRWGVGPRRGGCPWSMAIIMRSILIHGDHHEKSTLDGVHQHPPWCPSWWASGSVTIMKSTRIMTITMICSAQHGQHHDEHHDPWRSLWSVVIIMRNTLIRGYHHRQWRSSWQTTRSMTIIMTSPIICGE